MNAPQNHSFSCLDRRADPHDYEVKLPAHIERELAEMRDTLNRADARAMNRRFTGAALTNFGEFFA